MCLTWALIMRSLNSAMAVSAALLVLLPLAAAQAGFAAVQASNDTLPTPASNLYLTYSSSGGMTATAVVAPLTSEIGLGQSQTSLNSILIKGTLKLADGHSGSISSGNIACLSCDPNANVSPANIINEVILAIQPPVQAVLLYSLTAAHCSISGSFGYTSILSTTSIEDAQMLQNIIQMSSSTLPTATIADAAVGGASGTASNAGTSTGNLSSTTNQAPAPTTAVAMSILYSITGIITLLFLVIIATGAIRAHRHPERYGPRGGMAGRPRQSRAKGLARAMLETLPIVKFGDPDPVKPGSENVELEDGTHDVNKPAVVAPPQTTEGDRQPLSADASAAPEPAIGPDSNAGGGSHAEDTHGESDLGCSICTDDFEKGEDVRVLPCNHKYHPACIDPWLLNVSGTCPLCRVDLRPAETRDSEAQPTDAEDSALPPPLPENEDGEAPNGPRRGSVARRLDASVLRNAPAHVRLAALRALRDQQMQDTSGNAEVEAQREEQSRRARLTGRLRDVFRIRTRPEAGHGPGEVTDASAVSEATVTEPAAVAVPERQEHEEAL